MACVILILGSNLGNRHRYLEDARRLVESYIGIVNQNSSIYETEPWGFIDENLFLNQVMEIDTILDPLGVLNEIKKIELQLGRIRANERYGARTIDIDILFYNDLIINTPELIIPHPEMIKRRFVLEPLSEIVAPRIHPVYSKSIENLLSECQDICKVARV